MGTIIAVAGRMTFIPKRGRPALWPSALGLAAVLCVAQPIQGATTRKAEIARQWAFHSRTPKLGRVVVARSRLEKSFHEAYQLFGGNPVEKGLGKRRVRLAAVLLRLLSPEGKQPYGYNGEWSFHSKDEGSPVAQLHNELHRQLRELVIEVIGTFREAPAAHLEAEDIFGRFRDTDSAWATEWTYRFDTHGASALADRTPVGPDTSRFRVRLAVNPEGLRVTTEEFQQGARDMRVTRGIHLMHLPDGGIAIGRLSWKGRGSESPKEFDDSRYQYVAPGRKKQRTRIDGERFKLLEEAKTPDDVALALKQLMPLPAASAE